jgi:hypothetical protein
VTRVLAAVALAVLVFVGGPGAAAFADERVALSSDELRALEGAAAGELEGLRGGARSAPAPALDARERDALRRAESDAPELPRVKGGTGPIEGLALMAVYGLIAAVGIVILLLMGLGWLLRRGGVGPEGGFESKKRYYRKKLREMESEGR